MKKLILLLLVPFIVFIISSCDSNNTVTPTDPGSIYVTSNPAGAQIWLDNSNTNLVSPDTVENVAEGVHTVTLKLTDYRDTSLSISVTAGQMSVVTNVELVTNLSMEFYGSVRIYETYNTPASQPSGLDLSTGIAYGVSSPEADFIDIYFYSDAAGFSYLIQSADLHTGLIRKTDFLISTGTNLFDGDDSPLRNIGIWINKINDTEDNYVFLYDNDNHYSKMKIVNRGGGGGPGDPSWVDIQWYYNNSQLDNRF